jgi:hypothetical protein|tara:strand:- start:945 stop:1070 length:126 start_codon:yes stop_codon:yes gene_type:complete
MPGELGLSGIPVLPVRSNQEREQNKRVKQNRKRSAGKEDAN